MCGETSLVKLIKEMTPILNTGEYVFVTSNDLGSINTKDIICFFREKEGITLVLEKSKANIYALNYNFVASWITLKIHSSLDAVGLTAVFSTALGKHDISCNVIAGYYHDHIFVASKDAKKAIAVLNNLSNTYPN